MITKLHNIHSHQTAVLLTYALAIAVPAVALLAACASVANAAPELKMHIFNNPQHTTAKPKKNLKMFIFQQPPNAAPLTQQPPPVLPKLQPTPPQPVVTAKNLNTNQAITPQVDVHVDIGYRRDQLDWRIAAPSGTPNILSELQWQHIETVMLSTGADITFADHWQGEINLGYGAIFDGRNQDSDYVLDNRQDEFSRSNNVTEDGATIDVSGALGYHFDIGWKNTTPNLRLTPKLGYAFHTQQFNTTQGFQTIDTINNNLGSFDGLNSYYDATWFSVFAGLATRFNINQRLTLQGQVNYHLADYEGTGNWNLRDDFAHPQSFTQTAEGDGIVGSAVARYRVNPAWSLRLSADWQKWQANHNGINNPHFSDGSSDTTKFNGVNWDSYGFNVGVEYRF